MAGETVIGSYTGNGAAITINLGFVPDYVRVINVTDGDAGATWFNGMAAGTAIAEGAALATMGSNGITAFPGSLSASAGFTVGTTLSESAKVFRYIAIREGEY
jgi:hypothetical protein